MKTTESINEVCSALAEVQGKIIDAYKDSEGYGYKYADLASVLQIVRPLFSARGLCVMQDACVVDGAVSVTTRIVHKSGQWVETEPLLMAVESKKGLTQAQCVGSVITYARRYALTALVGITQDDDDASVRQAGPAVDNRILDLTAEIQAYLADDDVDGLRRSLAALTDQSDKAAVWASLQNDERTTITDILGQHS